MPPIVPVKARDKRIRLDLTIEEQQRLRIVAAQHGLSMSAFARSLVLGAIELETSKKTSKKS